MLPEWFTKPEALFWTVLFLLSPFYNWLVGKVVAFIKALHASRSEIAARVNIRHLEKALDNPPTLLESVAYLVCFLPIPIAQIMIVSIFYFTPFHPRPVIQVDASILMNLVDIILFVISFCNYVLFGSLAIYGIQVAYRLRHGEARYADNYKGGIQKRIDRLKKKFPLL